MKLKNWIIKKKITLIVMAIGAVAGFLYWSYVGCESGACVITSNRYISMSYGALVGWLIGDFASEKINSTQQK